MAENTEKQFMTERQMYLHDGMIVIGAMQKFAHNFIKMHEDELNEMRDGVEEGTLIHPEQINIQQQTKSEQ